jgi:hypothetical protein
MHFCLDILKSILVQREAAPRAATFSFLMPPPPEQNVPDAV